MLSDQYKLNFNVMLRKAMQGWIGPYGNITKAHIESYMPPVDPKTALMLIGGPNDVNPLH